MSPNILSQNKLSQNELSQNKLSQNKLSRKMLYHSVIFVCEQGAGIFICSSDWSRRPPRGGDGQHRRSGLLRRGSLRGILEGSVEFGIQRFLKRTYSFQSAASRYLPTQLWFRYISIYAYTSSGTYVKSLKNLIMIFFKSGLDLRGQYYAMTKKCLELSQICIIKCEPGLPHPQQTNGALLRTYKS